MTDANAARTSAPSHTLEAGATDHAGATAPGAVDLTRLYRPRAVAVVGASANPAKLGHQILRNIIDSGYTGQLYAVNPKETEILGRPCYPTIEAAPPVDLALIVVPAQAAVAVAEECGRHGVAHLVVITAGFKETGPEGARREAQLVEICRRYGMGLVGPNCLGVIDTHTPLNATFASARPLPGSIAFISQSGALGSAILDWSQQQAIGFSKFISLGNKAGLTEVDLILDAAADPETRVVAAYLEDVKDGARFLQAVGEASRRCPVLILKSGTSEAGGRAASSHTGALAGNDRAYEAAFAQTGVLRVQTLTELFALATAFANQPLPKGNRVAIVTNAGGPGIIATDAVERAGLAIARFTPETIKGLREKLPAECAVFDPVDVVGDAPPERYRIALDLVLQDPGVDAVVVLLTPQVPTRPPEVARHIVESRTLAPDKPVLVSMIGGQLVQEATEYLAAHQVPSFTFPEEAVTALAGMYRYARRRQRDGRAQATDVDRLRPDEVRSVFRAVRSEHRRVLLGPEAARVVAAYGVQVAPSELARTPDEAASIAERLGFPVALKIASPEIVHKSDVGGVRLKIGSADEVREAFVAIQQNVAALMPDHHFYGIEVSRMMPSGQELIVGMVRDHQFGPLLAFGMGGIYVNLLKDVSFRLAGALSRADVEEMIQETKVYQLLRGYRGSRPADVPALQEVLARVARLCLDFPEIAELDINPLFAYEAGKGVVAVDVKITLG
ncbi:MAG: acetate--CoA ligase family protein [Limnochordaceae bacterium]|nr:acetate--CoA ligase family protein [Limnochordaceae bacterium]